jgi:hypothetical protein
MVEGSEIGKFISGVKTEGLSILSPYSPKVIVFSQDSMVQQNSAKTVFELNKAGDCREFFDAFLKKPDIMVELSGKETAIAKAIDTIGKSPDISKKDLETISKVVAMGGGMYSENKDISRAVASANENASKKNVTLGKQLADTAMGALAKNQKAKDDAMNIH